MNRRTFLRYGAPALALAARGEPSAPGAAVQPPIHKPWPRPPVKTLRFDQAAIPTFQEMAALTAGPRTKRCYLQQPCDYKIVTARPDLKFQVYNATRPQPSRAAHATGYGFVIMRDGAPVSFNFENTEQRFEGARLPLLTQRLSQSGFQFEQVSFTTTGPRGKPLLMLRLKVTRQSSRSPRHLQLGWLTVRDLHRKFYSHANEDYIVFEPWGPAWNRGLNLTTEGNCQRSDDTLFDVFRHTTNVSVHSAAAVAGTALFFDLSFRQQPDARIEFRVPYECLRHPVSPDDADLDFDEAKAFSTTGLDHLLSLSFEEEYDRQAALWKQRLDTAARIHAPEKLVEDIYQVLTCNNLQFLGSARGVAYLRPGQGGFNNFSTVYGWESSNYLPVMERQGFHAEVGRVLDYFLTTQQGPNGPEGDISTAEGCFRPHIHWMCETGAILGIFAAHTLTSGDYHRLRKDSAALLKAARWIQGQRARTKDVLSDGTKSIHYGLMPAGRASDWPDYAYSLFTDAYTWYGLDKLARAFEQAGLADAVWLRAESDDYRRCIQAAMRRLLASPQPDTSSEPRQREEKPVLMSQIPLLETGLVPSACDLVSRIEAALRASGGMSDLFAQRMPQMEDDQLLRLQEKSAGGEIDLYYVNLAEKVWHRVWLERGERLKALRYFYMTLAYSTSRDLHLASERFSPQLVWLLPWQPNASGNGRILEMMLNTLYLEDGDSAHLLAGVPDAWFAAAQPLGVERLHTPFGQFSFMVKPAQASGHYELSYQSSRDIPKRFLVSLPDRGQPQSRRVVRVDTRDLRSATFLMDAATGSVSHHR